MLTEWDEAVATADLLFTLPRRFNSLGSHSAFARLILFDKFVFPPTRHAARLNKRVRLSCRANGKHFDQHFCVSHCQGHPPLHLTTHITEAGGPSITARFPTQSPTGDKGLTCFQQRSFPWSQTV